jgi:hypothetical protein
MEIPWEGMMLSPRVFAVFLFVGLPCYAQTDDQFFALTDVSGPHSPIKVTGQVSWHQEIEDDAVVNTLCGWHAELLNLSSKPILAYEVSFDLLPRYGGKRHTVFQEDGFFTENISFTPGSQEPLDHDCSSRTWQSDRSGVPSKPRRFEGIPRAESKIIFVQFSDGSTYEASDWGKNLTKSRFTLLERINELLEAYERGEDSLRATIAQQTTRSDNTIYLGNVLQGFNYQLETKGVEAFVTRLNEELRIAVERASLLHDPTDVELEDVEEPATCQK